MFRNAFFIPILPGKTEAAREFGRECNTSRRDQYDASRRRLGLTAEYIWLQHTPMGDFNVLYMQGESRDKMFGGLIQSQDPFDIWFKDKIKEIHGFDMKDEGDHDDGPNELFIDWQDGDTAGTTKIGFFAPILKDKTEDWKKFARAFSGEKAADHAASRRSHGCKSERAWLQTDDEHGDFVVVVLDVKDPSTFFQSFLTPQSEFDKFFAQGVKELHGMDVSTPPPPNELLGAWQAQPVAAK